jgi:hypothetical protein
MDIVNLLRYNQLIFFLLIQKETYLFTHFVFYRRGVRLPLLISSRISLKFSTWKTSWLLSNRAFNSLTASWSRIGS